MKNTILSLTALALFTVAFSSCKKEATFEDQLVGNWKSVEVKAGTSDVTNSNSFDLRLQSSNEFDLDITVMVPFAGNLTKSYNGDWTGNDAKQDLTLIYYGNGEMKTWEVVALSDTGMTTELVEDNVRYQVRFERQ